MAPIYLDAFATTPLDPRVADEIRPWLAGTTFGNAGSPHPFGERAAEALNAARRRVAGFFNAEPRSVVFTSGATESNNLALSAALATRGAHVISGVTEHASVFEPLRAAASEGAIELALIGVNRCGELDLDELRAALQTDTALVSLMAANNENGVINPTAEIGRIVHPSGALFHSDGAQAAGKIPLDFQASGIDMLSISAHKMYGPMGTGALLVSERAREALCPLLRGGGQEGGLRSGTVNVPGAVGLGAACERAAQDLEHEVTRLAALRDRLEASLLELGGVEVNGTRESRLPGSLSLTIEGVPGDALLAGCPDLAFSQGSACSTGSPAPSRVLLEMGLSADEADQTVRFGLTRQTSKDEVDQAAEQLRTCIERVRGLVHA